MIHNSYGAIPERSGADLGMTSPLTAEDQLCFRSACRFTLADYRLPFHWLSPSKNLHTGTSNSSGFMLIWHSFARQPLNCRNDCTPSRMRMCVKPISLMNSSFECSESVGMVLVTRNIVLIMSCDEYPRSLSRLATRLQAADNSSTCGNATYHNSLSESTAPSTLPSQQALIIA